MKKFVVGFVCGAIIAGGSAVYANDAVQALLFPVKYEVNGVGKELPEGYHTLNVAGRAYVPVRFVSENLGAVVAYDEAAKIIRVDDGFDLRYSPIRAGYLKVVKSGEQLVVKGKLYVSQTHWDTMAKARNAIVPGSELPVGGTLMFYNAEGAYLGKAEVKETFIAQGDQIKDFTSTADADVTGYTFVAMAHEFPMPSGLPVPPDVSNLDPTGKVGIGNFQLQAHDGFTEVKGWISLKVAGRYQYQVTMTFLDGAGKELGTAQLKSSGEGSDPVKSMSAVTFETAGKGDFTTFKQVKVSVDSFVLNSATE